MDFDAEVSVKDIVNFYIKINDAVKAKRDLAQLSSKDKAAALEIIASSSAQREFKVEVAKYFIYDLDNRLRRKAEIMMETLVPGWVSDPAESILKLLKSSDQKGDSRRNAAVRFLFGIVDAASLRDTFMTLLSSRNRTLMHEIISILEDYIDASVDEAEQVRIFDACLDIILSDDTDNNMKHYASTLLSVFFKKVQSTSLGEVLRKKYIEKQIEKADGVYRYLCSGTAGLNPTFLEDLLRPLAMGGSVYQTKILTYFNFVLEKARNPSEVDTVIDTYPDYWNQEEPSKESKLTVLCQRIVRAVDELWDQTDDPEVRGLIVKVRYGEYANKRDLLDQIKLKLEEETLSSAAREKICLMLQCFLQPDEDDTLKLQVAHELLFTLGGRDNQEAALKYLRLYVETKNLNYAERGSIAAVIEMFLDEPGLPVDIRELARYILFVAAAEKIVDIEDQKALMGYVRSIVEGRGFEYPEAENRVIEALTMFEQKVAGSEKLRKAAKYLEFKIRNPKGIVGTELSE